MSSQPPSSAAGGSGGERIVAIEVRDEMRRSFMDYAMSVIVSRAIPDVRDGLKPVHRRIIFGMYELNLFPNERFRKCAKVVGEVMGNFHPHGDSAIYESLVRLAQPSASRYVLADGHGNFGDLDNPPAAMRYTEVKLAVMATEMLQDIDAETVDMRSNFDDSRKEPVVLPSRVPTLLLNGSAGIAVGMATNIPPHNLTEIIDGLIQFIDHPEWMEADPVDKNANPDEISVRNPAVETSRRLMQWIKGPDFPMGGVIMGTEGIIDAYTTGRGSIPVRGEAVIDQISGSGRQTRMGIIVKSLPYMVGPEAFTKRVAELVREDKITGISDVNDETNRHGTRVVIELKRDAHPEVILNNLYKHTQLQQSFPVNTLALVRKFRAGSAEPAFEPATLCLANLLQEFVDHRIEVVTRRTRYYLKKAEDRAHILEGYLKALANLDKVISIIRGAQSTEEARQGLIAEFQLDEPQANAILEMQLRRLTGLERGKIEKEYAEQQAKISEYRGILAERQKVLDIIKAELMEIRTKYGGDKDPRLTRIEGSVEQLSSKDLTPNEPMAIFITKQDYIKRMPLDTFKRQRRNTRGVTGVKTREEDDLRHFFTANMHDRLLVFTTKGSVYSLEVMDLPEGGRTARGTALVNLLSIGQDESVTAVIPVETFSEDTYLIMLTHKAYIKKVQMSELANIRRSGIISITLNDGDELGWVRPSTGKADVLIGTGDGMCIRYSEEELRPMGRTARGVRAITLREGDTIVGFDVIEPGNEAHVLVVTTDGFGKRVKLDEFRQQGRGGIGLIGTKFKNAHSRLATLRLVQSNEEVMIATANGIVVRQRVGDISSQGRMATGVRIQQIGEDDQVVSVTALVEPDEVAADLLNGDTNGGASGPEEPES